ncbi:YebC/PmpR family DNA-binding transcriptional regulator [Candidatus Shapirobacteria bacterium]|nr:YebC/PmpR family DNA-binding transcriptional regulator [Candidatus Shapirobacteria bacterium]
MSGHSKWENIKRKKGVEDKKRGQVFSRFARQITTAIREGGSADPENNSRLRAVIEEAKTVNMPKSNIDRLLQKGEGQKDLATFWLEGYGPQGLAVMIEIATDNRQRSTQEIKNIFHRFQGSLAEPGSVAFQFERLGVVKTPVLSEEIILGAGEWGAVDFKQEKETTIFYLSPEKLNSFKENLVKQKIKILFTDWAMIAKNPVRIDNSREIKGFLKEIEEHNDILRAFTNLGLKKR